MNSAPKLIIRSPSTAFTSMPKERSLLPQIDPFSLLQYSPSTWDSPFWSLTFSLLFANMTDCFDFSVPTVSHLNKQHSTHFTPISTLSSNLQIRVMPY